MPRARAAGPTPFASALIAVRNGATTIGGAVESILRQSLRELEVIVVDDGSNDDTREVLARFTDPRLRIVHFEHGRGRAAALSVGLREARANLIFRLDADDFAMPDRFERQLAAMRARPELAVLGSAVFTFSDNSLGRVAAPFVEPDSVRWAALFSSPFLHPTVVFDKDQFERAGLAYDESFDESEDYQLWVRALGSLRGANLAAPLTLYRVHPGQASQLHRPRQRELQRRVACDAITTWLPELGLTVEQAEQIWAVGAGEALSPEEERGAVVAFLALLDRFSASAAPAARREVSRSVARLLARRALTFRSASTFTLLRAIELDPLLAVPRGAMRSIALRQARSEATNLLRDLGSVAPS